jgi:predicted DNA-binding transcriptional regulator YafY
VDGLPEIRLWRLDRIASVGVLDRGFDRREDFNLSAYSAQSFGVFQEEPINVILSFSREVAGDASGWLFHPSQTANHHRDGSLTISFSAGGIQEMVWHLLTWGSSVTVVSPDSLRRQLITHSKTAFAHHSKL